MAEIVLGIGTSHGPMLSTPPDQWHQRVVADRQRQHPFRGQLHGFEALARLRADEALARECTLPRMQERFAECRAAIAGLEAAWARARPDVVVMVGNDQMELFSEANLPAFAVHYGDVLENVPYTPAQLARLMPGLAIAEPGHHGSETEIFPGHPGLARHLIGTLLQRQFDPAALKKLPSQPDSYSTGLPHAYGFVYRQIMKAHVCPAVLVLVNTFYPPNQPSAGRCHALGHAIAAAVASWPGQERVAIVGSGGMSHFVVDEALDRPFMDALERGDAQALLSIDEALYQSGSSELKNWLPLAGAMQAAGLAMRERSYVPCYRSEAGTGSGMGFACWS